MTLALAELVAAGLTDSVDRTTYTGGTATPTARRLLLVWVNAERTTSDVETPTFSGWGFSWTAIGNHAWTTGGATNRQTFLFGAFTGAAPGSGAAQAVFANTHIGCEMMALEVQGADQSGTVANAIVQVVGDSGSNPNTITFSAASHADNRQACSYSINQNNQAIVFTTTGWTQGTDRIHSAPTMSANVGWRTSGFDTSVVASNSPSSGGTVGSLGVEIKAANYTGATALTGLGSQTIVGVPTRKAASALTGVGSSSASGIKTRLAAVALTAAGTLSATGKKTRLGAAVLTGTGSLSATARALRYAAAALSGVGSSTSAGVKTRLAAAALSGTGMLAATARATRFAAVALVGAGSATIVGTKTRLGSAALTGTGVLVGTAKALRYAASVFTGTGSLAASGDVEGGGTDHTGTVALVSTGSLSATAVRGKLGVAALTGTGSAVVVGVRQVTAPAALSGTGSLSATGNRVVPGAAVLSGSGSITASGTRTAVGVAHLIGLGTAQASALLGRLGAASLTATGSLYARPTPDEAIWIIRLRALYQPREFIVVGPVPSVVRRALPAETVRIPAPRRGTIRLRPGVRSG